MTDPTTWTGDGDWLPLTRNQPSNLDNGSSLNDDAARRWLSTTGYFRSQSLFSRVRFALILSTTIIIICAISGWIGWATSSIRPPSTVDIVLLGTDYHDNYLIAPNLDGDRVLGKIASLCTENVAADDSRLRLHTPPLDLQNLQSVQFALDTLRGGPVLVYLSAHGFSSPAGPVLLPRHAERFDQTILLTDILELLSRLPADSPKTLVLDATHIRTDHHWGILHNDFAHQVRELNDKIESVPNLVVILDCNVDQRGWSNPLTGTTVFGEAWIDGLIRAEDSNSDGWIDLLDLHRHCATNVKNWVETRFAAPQDSILLPLGSEGEKRAAKLAFRRTSDDPFAAPPALVSPSRPDLLDHWWETYEEFNQRVPHPAIATPLLWDRYVAAILRFEHFELRGSRESANWLNQQLETLYAEISVGRPIDSSSARSGVVSPTAAGTVPDANTATTALSIAQRLLAVENDHRRETWNSAIEQIDSPYQLSQLRRQVLIHLVNESIADSILQDPAANNNLRAKLRDTSRAIEAIQDPLQPEQTLATVFRLLARDLPEEFYTQSNQIRLGELLILWLRCDDISDNSLGSLAHLEPAILPWVNSLLRRGDVHRRLALDLIVGNDVSRERADDHLRDAEKLYAAVDSLTQTLATAETHLRMGWNSLAYYVSTIEAQANESEQQEYIDRYIAKLHQAYSSADQLAQFLAKRQDVEENECDTIRSQLQLLYDQFSRSLDDLEIPLSAWHKSKFSGNSAAGLETALTIPGGDGPMRRAAWDKLQSVVMHSNAAPVDTEINNEIPSRARLLGHLALAPWNEADFNQLSPNGANSYDQVSHHLDIFSVEQDWRTELTEIGSQIAHRYETAREMLGTDQSIEFTPEQRRAIARRFDSLLPSNASRSIAHCAQVDFADYLAAIAERTVADCLDSVDQQNVPQFARTSAQIIEDASRYTTSDRLKSIHLQIEAANSLTLDAADSIDWTTEVQRTISLEIARQDDPNPGFVTITANSKSPFNLIQPVPGDRVCRPIRTSQRIPDPVAPAMLDEALLHVGIDQATLDRVGQTDPSTELDEITGEIQVEGYFRGRRLTSSILVQLHKNPKYHILVQPKSDQAKLAIRSPLGNSSDQYNGSVAIVLDCSGSMGSAPGQAYDANTKHAQAVSAIKTLLSEIPRGVRLSVWTFGQSGTPQKTVKPAERTIRRLLDPVAWDPSRKDRIEELVSRLEYPATEPWNESPLIASLIASAQDLRAFKDDFRTIIVITDGFDNRIEEDNVNNPSRLSAQDVLRQSFAGTGIALNVIGFRVDNSDSLHTQESLSVIRTLIRPGRYVAVNESEKLISALRGCLQTPKAYQLRKANGSINSPPLMILRESPHSGAIRWTDSDLTPDLYELTTIAGQRSSSVATIELKAGDQLVLQRTNNNTIELASQRDTTSPASWRDSDKYAVSVSNAVAKYLNAVAQRLLIEPKHANPLAVNSPSDVWIETQNEQNFAWRSYLKRCENSVGNEYVINIPNVSSEASVFTSVYISPTMPLSVGQLLRDRDFKHFADLAPGTMQDSAGEVLLRSAAIETWNVPDQHGNLSPQPCLVMRIECPPKEVYRLRPRGITIRGYDERYYDGANAYTYRAWPVTQADVEHRLRSVELISVRQQIESATRSGMAFHFQPEGLEQVTRTNSQQSATPQI